MLFPDEKVAEVCRLDAGKALDLLDRALKGDEEALIGYTIRAGYRSLLTKNVPPAAALLHVRNLVRATDFQPRLTP